MKIISQLKNQSALAAFFLLLLSLLASAPGAAQTPVTVKPYNNVAIYPAYSAPANAASINNTNLSAEISGRIEEIPARVGDNLEPGDIIAKIDCRQHIYLKQQAEASHTASAAEYKLSAFKLKRAKKLFKSKTISEELFNERDTSEKIAKAQLVRLRAGLEIAKQKVDQCEIRAPYKALLTKRIASVGDLMSVGTPVAKIIDREQLEVIGNVQTQDIKPLKSSEALNFTSDGESYPLKIRSIIPVVDSRIRSFAVHFVFAAEKATPGSTGRIEWRSTKKHLPSELLLRKGNALGVFIERDGQAVFIKVDNAREGQPAHVELTDTTNIIIDGRFALADGDAVKLIAP